MSIHVPGVLVMTDRDVQQECLALELDKTPSH